jgi:FSR family fosmidomycin resistance protein-like MFS transporter
LLLSVPGFIAALVEPGIGLAGDTRHRRVVVVVGGASLAAALVATSLAPGFLVLLVAAIAMYPASGAFVNLSQANLMDLAPHRRERNMARWVLAGSLGSVIGPLVLAGAVIAGVGWRSVFALLAALSIGLAAGAWIVHPAARSEDPPAGALLRTALGSLRDREVVRWLLVLELQDLQGDILLGFLALYLVDVAGASRALAGIAVAIWTLGGLAGTIWLVRATRRLDGLRYLRVSTVAALLLFPAFLLVPSAPAKLTSAAAIAALTAGWYPIAKARLFATMPGASGTAIALCALASLLGTAIPLVVAVAATHLGLGRAMWLLMLGPLAVLALLPRTRLRD